MGSEGVQVLTYKVIRADTLTADSAGIVFVRKERLQEVTGLRLPVALALVLPGWLTQSLRRNSQLMGLISSVMTEATLTLEDDVQDWCALRTVTLINL